MGFIGTLHSLRSFRRRLPLALCGYETPFAFRRHKHPYAQQLLGGNWFSCHYPELPADARKVVERSAACRHFADEIAGNGSENDRQVKRQIKKLRCNSLENDANRIRQKYKSRPEVLRLMDESMA